MKASLASVFLLLASAAGFAQTGDCAALTRQALEISGFNQSLDQVSEEMNSDAFGSQLAGAGGNSGQFATVFKPIVQKHLDSQLMRKDLEMRLVAHCNLDQMTRTVERLKSPLVARMLVMEAAANSPEGREKAERYAKVVSLAPPPDSRIDAVEAIDSSAGVTDMTVNTMIAVTRGMMEGAGLPELAGAMEPHRQEIKAQMHKEVQISLLSTYRSATTPDLLLYAKELGSEPLKSFYRQASKALSEMVEARAHAIGEDLKPALTAAANQQ